MKISAFLLLALSVVLVALPTRNISAASAPGVVTTQPARKVDLAYLALSKRTRFAVENYLRTDCEVGEVGKALLALLPFSEKATPYLKAVRQEGPPTPVIRALNKGLKKAWRARLAFLETPDALELGEESFRMMKAITQEQYFKEQRASLQAKYRERATIGLERLACLRRAGSDGVEQCIKPIEETPPPTIP